MDVRVYYFSLSGRTALTKNRMKQERMDSKLGLFGALKFAKAILLLTLAYLIFSLFFFESPYCLFHVTEGYYRAISISYILAM